MHASAQPVPPTQAAYPIFAWLSRRNWLLIGAFVLPFTLYILTAAPTIYNLDSAELTTAAATGGIVRATGYPLYLLLGRIWTVLLPVGDMGFRMNLFSALCGAATIMLVAALLQRLRVSSWAIGGAAALLATAPYFWSLSLVAEVYTLHTLLMSALVLILFQWRRDPAPWRLFAAVLLMTLSLGNHAATVLLVPGAVWFVLSHQPLAWLKWRNLAAGAAGLIVGALVFLYLPLRYGAEPAFNYAGTYDATGRFNGVDLQTLDGVWWLISGRSFASQMFGYSFSQLGTEIRHFVQQLSTAFLLIGIGPGLVGFVTLWRREWRFAGLLTLFFVGNSWFYINYRVIDKSTMFLPAYVIWAIWAAVGYDALNRWLLVPLPPSTRWRYAIPTVALSAGVLAIAANWSLVNLSDDYSTREQSESILEQVGSDAIILGWWDTIPGIQYLQFVENQRPDVLAINRFLISGDDMTALIRRNAATRPIYIDNPPVTLIREMQTEHLYGNVYRLIEKRAAPGTSAPNDSTHSPDFWRKRWPVKN